MARIPSLYLYPLMLAAFSVFASAQFNIFDQFFGGHQHAQQHQSRRLDWYAQHYDAAQCGQYLCPDTLSCVGEPKDCPCPFGQDKCALGKAGDYVCVSPINGLSGCDIVMLYRKGEMY